MNIEKLLEGLCIENVTVGEVKELSSKWNVTHLSLLNTLNKIDNKYPVTVEYVIKSLLEFTDEAIKNNYTLKQAIGLSVLIKPFSVHYNHELPLVDGKVGGVSLRRIIERAGSVENIINKKAEDFGVYMIHKVKLLQDKLTDENSYYNQIVA